MILYIASLLNVYSFTVYIGSVVIAITALWREIVMLKVHQSNAHSFNNLSESFNYKRLIETNSINLKNAKNKRQRRSDSSSEEEQVRKNNKLFDAVKKKIPTKERMKKIEKALDQGANINAQDKNRKQNTPLHLAVSKGDLAIVQFLLEHGADKTIENRDHKTPLMLANGNQPIIDAFNPPQLALANQQQSFPLPVQPIGGPSSKQYRLELSETSFTHIDVPADGSCLFWAVTLAYLMPVKNDEAALRERCARLFGNVVYILAPIKGWLQNYQPTSQTRNPARIQTFVTEILRNRVIDQLASQESQLKETVTLNDLVKSQNQDFITTGSFQAEFRREFSAEISLYGVDIHRLKPTVLDSAAIESMESELDKLYDLQEKVKQFKFRQYLAQMRQPSSWGGNHELQAISQLLECSIKIFSDVMPAYSIPYHNSHLQLHLFHQGESHYQFGLIKTTLLQQAIKSHQLQTAQAYLELGVYDINQQDSKGWTALHFAAQKGNLALVKLLLAQGAKTDSRNHFQQTPLEVARFFEQHYIVIILSKLEPSEPRVVGQPVVVDTSLIQPHVQPKRNINKIEDEQQSALIKKRKGEEPRSQHDKKSKIPVALKRTQVEDDEAVDVPLLKASKTDLPEAHYAASGLKLSLHGTAYQLKLLMLFLKRGLDKKYNFRLATEMDAAEKFDDVVFEYRQRSQSHYRFLQAKHKQDEGKEITSSELFNETEEEFSLQKYFNAYRKIKQKPEFKAGEIDDVIIYTNIGFDFEEPATGDSQLKKLAKKELYMEKVETPDDVLDIGGERYRLVSHSYQDERDKVIAELTPLFERGSDLNQLATSLAQSLLSKKDSAGNSQIGLNEPFFKQYRLALVETVINVDNKKFHENFLSGQSLSPPAQAFRAAFRDAVLAVLRGLQRKKNLATEDKALLDTLTDRSVSWIPLPIASDRQPTDKERAFWQQIGKKTFNLSKQFGKTFKLENNPQLTDSQKLAHEIAVLIKQSSNNNKIVKIERRKGVIKDNIDKLAGHVLIYRDEGENGKIYFSKRFLQPTQPLPDALQTFRDNLKTALEQQKIPFNTLSQYQLTIPQFQTCQEEALEASLTKQRGLPEGQVTTQEIAEFIDKLVFAVNQPNEMALGDLIKDELGEEFNLIDSDLVASQVQNEMFNWFKKGKEKGKKGQFLSRAGGEEIFTWARQKVNSLILIGPTLDYQAKMKEFGIHFTETAFTPLHNFVTAGHQILHWIAPEETLLCAIKVYQVLTTRSEYQKQDSYLFMQLSALARPEIQQRAINAFASKRSHHLLVIEGTSAVPTVSSIYQRLSKVLRENLQKKIIFITQENNALVTQFKTNFKDKTQVEKDNPRFSDLMPDTQQKLLAKNVDFQGYQVTLNQLIDPKQPELINSIPLLKLIDNKLVIGKKWPISSGYDEDFYIERTFNHQIAIKRDIFHAKQQEKFPDLLSSTEQEFKQLCRQHPGSNIHWLKSEPGGKVIWQKSQGSLSALREFIDTHHIQSYPPENLNDFLKQTQHHKVMLISDAAGMGKTTVLTQLSKQLKQKFQTHWVVRIDLNDHTDALKKQTQWNEKLSSDIAVEFLSQELLKLETPLEQVLFKQCFEPDGKVKVALLLDGFDEISPNYKNTVIYLLQALRKKSIDQLWVTTRPHMKEVLEDKLQQLSYTLEPFSPENQISFLTRFWRKELALPETSQQQLEIYADMLIKKLAESISDKETEFTGIPLQTRMLADAFKQEVKQSFDFDKEALELPDRLNLLELYERFIYKKYSIYQEEKAKISESNVVAEEQQKRNLKGLRKKHQQLALQVLFIEEQVRLLQAEDTPSEFSNEELTRIGIVQTIDDRPHFIHRTFAEYFASDFLASQLQEQHQMMEAQNFFLTQVLLQEDCQVIRAFLNGQLKKNPLSQDAFTEYGKYLSKLWSEDSLDYENEGTILHIACREGNNEIVNFLFNSLKNQKEALKSLVLATLKYKETVLHSATASGNWKLVKKLLDYVQNDVETSEPGTLKSLVLKTTKHTGETVLHLVAERKNWNLIENLLDYVKDNVESSEPGTLKSLMLEIRNDGATVLHIAAKSGNWEFVKQLLGYVQHNFESSEPGTLKSLVLEIRNDGATVLHIAAKSGNWEFVRQLFGYIKDNFESSEPGTLKSLILATTGYGETILHRAAASGNWKLVKKLLNYVQDNFESSEPGTLKSLILATTGYGETVLHQGVASGNWKLVEKLLNYVQNNVESTAPGTLKSLVLAIAIYEGTALNKAAASGNWELIGQLLGYLQENVESCVPGTLKSLVLATANYEKTVLHQAVASENWELIKQLLGYVQDNIESSAPGTLKSLMLSTAKDGVTVLHLAARGNWELIGKLLDYVQDNVESCAPGTLKSLVLATAEDGKTVLHLAVKRENWELVKKLLDYVQNNVESIAPGTLKSLVLATAEDGETVLHLAVKSKNWELVKKLLDCMQNNVESTAPGVLKSLVLATTKDGETVLHRAARGNWELIGKLLGYVQNNAESCAPGTLKSLVLATAEDGKTVLHLAVKRKNWELVKKLLDYVQNNVESIAPGTLKSLVLATAEDGETLLHLAAKSKNWELVKKLLDYMQYNVESTAPGALKSLVLATTKDGETVLHQAVESENWNLVKKLLDYVQDNIESSAPGTLKSLVLETTEVGTTPLHLAARSGNWELMEQLLGYVQDNAESSAPGTLEKVVLATTKDGETVLHLAAESGNWNLIKKLLDYVQDKIELTELKTFKSLVLETNENGETVLHRAASCKNWKIVEQLLDYVQNNVESTEPGMLMSLVLETTKDGETVLHRSAEIENWKIVKKLLDYVQDNAESSEPGTLNSLVLATRYDGANVLHRAAANGNWDLVNQILDYLRNYVKFNAPETLGKLVLAATTYGETVLKLAAESENWKMVKRLLDYVQNNVESSEPGTLKRLVLETTEDEVTVLHRAAASKNWELVEKLLDYVHDNFESSAPGTLKRLVLATARYKGTALHQAARSGNWEFVKKLLDYVQKNVESCDPGTLQSLVLATGIYEGTVLYQAARSGDWELAKQLLDYVQNNVEPHSIGALKRLVLATAEYRETVLHQAAESGKWELVKKLLDYLQKNVESSEPGTLKSLVLSTAEDGETVLHRAARSRNLWWIEKLLGYVLNCVEFNAPDTLKKLVSATNAYGETVLHQAAEIKNIKLVKKLFDYLQDNIESSAPGTLKNLLLATTKNGETVLHRAAERENCKLVKMLLDYVQDNVESSDPGTLKSLVLKTTEDGENILHRAVDRKNWMLIGQLFGYVQDNFESSAPGTLKSFVLATTKDGDTVLHRAAERKNWKLVKKLLDYVQDNVESSDPGTLKSLVLKTTEDGENILHRAASSNSWELVEQLLDYVQDNVESSDPGTLKSLVLKTTKDGENILHLAESDNNWELVEQLLDYVQDNVESIAPGTLNSLMLTISKYSGTILHHVVRYRNWKLVKNLLDYVQDNVERNAPGTLEKLMLEPTKDGETVLHIAAVRENCKLVKKLLDYVQENVESTAPGTLNSLMLAITTDGETVLHQAAGSGNWELVKQLLDYVQNNVEGNAPGTLKSLVLAITTDGETVLHRAAESKNWNLVTKLSVYVQDNIESIEPGTLKSLVLATQYDGATVLHRVAENGKWESVQQILGYLRNYVESSASGTLKKLVFATTKDGETLLHRAASSGNWKLVMKLLNYVHDNVETNDSGTLKSLVLETTEDGETILHRAARSENWELVKKLLDYVHDYFESSAPRTLKSLVLATAKFKGTALHQAAMSGNWELVKKLLDYVQKNVESSEPGTLKSLVLATTKYGETVIHLVVKSGYLWLIEKLLSYVRNCVEYSAPGTLKELVLATTKDGETVLHQTAARNNWDIAIILLNAGANIKDLSDEQCNLLKNYVVNTYNENNERIIQSIEDRQSILSIESISDLTKLITQVELEPSGSIESSSCSSGRKKRHIRLCIRETKRFFPYDPLEESILVTQAHAARIYSQLVLALAWERPELFTLGRSEILDKGVTYHSYLGEIIHEGKANQSPREQGVLAAHYQQAQQFLSDFPQKQLLKKLFNAAVDLPPSQAQSPLAHRSLIFDNGQHSLLVLFDGDRYQLYSQDFNYRQRFQTGQFVPYSQIEAFARAFFKWRSGSDSYTRYRLVEHLPSIVISHLQNALLWTPERVASDRVLLENQPLTEIEGLQLETIRQMVRLAGQVPDLAAMHHDFFQQQAHGIQLNVEALHHLLPTLTSTQCQALVTLVKKYDFSADTTAVNALSIDERPLLQSYQGKVLDELKAPTVTTITTERLSELSWQALDEEFDKHPDISFEIKQQVLTTTQQIHTIAAKRAWAKGMATQTLLFLPDMIRAANTGQVAGLATTAGMLTTDGTLNSLYGRLIEHLAPTLSETRVTLLQKLPITSPVFKALTLYSIVELTQQLKALPANSAQRQNIQHRLGEQCITTGLMVAELLGFEVTPLWIGLIAEQLIFEVITFRKENQVDIPFWEAFLMSLGFEQDKLRDIFEERQLVQVNLATVDRLNTQAMPTYGWTVVKVPLLGNVEWQDIVEQQIPEAVKQQVMRQPDPFSFFMKEQRTREAAGFRQIQRYEIKLVGSRGMAVAVRGALLETRWQRGYYPAQPAAIKVQFTPGDSGYQEDNIFLDTPAGELTNYRRIAAVTGPDYKQWVSNSPMQIRGPGLAALYVNNHTFSDINSQRNLYLGFDPCEGDITLEFTAKGLERLDEINRAHNPHYLINNSLPYIVTLQVGHKPYPESILFPQQGGLMLLKDSSGRVNSQYFVSSESSPFRIRDDAIATRIAFTRINTNTTEYVIRSDGPEIIQMQVEHQTANNATLSNPVTMPLLSTLWLKGHKKYLQLMLQHQIIDGTLTLAAERLEVLYAKGKTAAHSSLEIRPSVLTFAVTVMGHLRVTHAANTLMFIGARPNNAMPICYAKPLSASYGAFYQLEIADLRPILNSLSRSNVSDMDFSTPELRYRWQPNTVGHTPLKITGVLNGQAACLTLEQNSTTLTLSDHHQQSTSIEVVHYTQQAVLDNRLVLQQIVTPPRLNSSVPGHYQAVADAQTENGLLVVNIISSCGTEDILLFQAPQGYPVAHRFPNSDKITLNDIDYQIQGHTLYAIGAKDNVITNEKLIRTQGAKSSVAIRFATPLSDSQLALDKGSLLINHLMLRHLPERTLIYFNQHAFPLKALQDTLQRPIETQPLPVRQRRDLPSDAVTSSAQRPTLWPTSVFKSVSTLLVGMLNPWLQRNSGPSTSPMPVLTLSSEPTPQTPKTIPSLLELGDQWLAQANHQGLLQLLDLVIRKCTGQKYPQWQAAPSCSQPAVQAQAAVMVDEFNRKLNQTALACGIKLATINNQINLVKLQQQVAQKLYANQIEAIPALLNQTVQQIRQQIKGIASQKQADKFLARFDNTPTSEVDIGHLRQQMVSTLNDTVGVTARVHDKIDALPSCLGLAKTNLTRLDRTAMV